MRKERGPDFANDERACAHLKGWESYLSVLSGLAEELHAHGSLDCPRGEDERERERH